ncbi:hypothetical protein ACFO1B_21985 [Dactylosporangium siamense]|nr:hypothetical protein [Dactylosporangium siamense]
MNQDGGRTDIPPRSRFHDKVHNVINERAIDSGHIFVAQPPIVGEK